MNLLRSLLGASLIFIAALAPATAQGTYYLNIILLIPEEISAASPGGCNFDPTPTGVYIDLNTVPFAREESKFFEEGYTVDGATSPVPGMPGCVLARTFVVDQADAYLLNVEIAGQDGTSKNVDLGQISWDQYLTAGESPIIFVIDDVSLAEGEAASVNFGPPAEIQPTPDLMATIQAQEAEIESLKATIEAIETPEP